MKIGINGVGRMGRLALRAGWDVPELDFVALNEPHASPEVLATLLEFDSVQGRWHRSCEAGEHQVIVDGHALPITHHDRPESIPWQEHGVEMVLECSGAFRRTQLLAGHFERGVRKVVVSAPVNDGPPNIVVGVNHEEFDLSEEPVLTAASCTTNCLAPVVRVLHDTLGIERGLATTIHDPTNTQSVQDAPHSDPRRARASQLSLIPTSTNSATAVTLIIPELKGRLDSIAVRAPVLNASLTDFTCQVSRDTTIEEVNSLLKNASTEGPLVDILGFETRPLVSIDYAGDPRSAIVDASCTRVTDGRLVKVMAWYDNEWGYANRLVELASMVAQAADQRKN
ncbi:ArsJ-associated glyceraldehyde-3-phosphate dehydrogenase [Myxococcota bacterium]|nr:ArsJ-associated glyceraldehyde-3-phosphate dehydrogenase [Myxococcota bacterium]